MSKLFGAGVYMVVENPHQEDAGIELLGGDWDGLVYQYGKVQFEEGNPQINFQRTIRRLPHNAEKTEVELENLLNNSELNTLMGDILVEVMQEQIKKEDKNHARRSSSSTSSLHKD